jgi:hypothetical protein
MMYSMMSNNPPRSQINAADTDMSSPWLSVLVQQFCRVWIEPVLMGLSCTQPRFLSENFLLSLTWPAAFTP